MMCIVLLLVWMFVIIVLCGLRVGRWIVLVLMICVDLWMRMMLLC